VDNDIFLERLVTNMRVDSKMADDFIRKEHISLESNYGFMLKKAYLTGVMDTLNTIRKGIEEQRNHDKEREMLG
jgi:hypothetical protein